MRDERATGGGGDVTAELDDVLGVSGAGGCGRRKRADGDRHQRRDREDGHPSPAAAVVGHAVYLPVKSRPLAGHTAAARRL
jgi:hypothetical protein